MTNAKEHHKFSPRELTTTFIESLSPKDAEQVAINMLAKSARIREHGKILSWSEFNENPDLLVNRLLARIIVGQFDRSRLQQSSADQVAVLSIESSASYLAIEMAKELERSFAYTRPPRIVRARKLPRGESPSPAMSTHKLTAEVRPITAGGEKRTLLASLPEDDGSLPLVRTVVVVDDFKATQSTINGGIELANGLFTGFSSGEKLLIIPTAGLGKPDQIIYNEAKSSQAEVWGCITALDVHYGPDPATGGAYIQANGFARLPMARAKASDFI